MSFIIPDRVRETTSTTGTTSPLVLLGAWPQFQSFAAGVGNGNNCEYTLLSGDGAGWENGLGTVTSGAPNTLSRDTVLSSSNSNALISLTGTSTVFGGRSAASYRATMGVPIVPPPVAASWTKKGFTGTAALIDCPIGPVLTETFLTTDQMEIAVLASPTPPYTIDAILSLAGCSLAGNQTSANIGWTDGTKIQMMSWVTSNASNLPQRASANNWTNSTTFSAVAGSAVDVHWSPSAIYARIADNGTNVTFSMSNDGFNFVQIYTVAKASGFLGSSGYSSVGWGMEAFAGAGANNPPSAYVVLKSWWVH